MLESYAQLFPKQLGFTATPVTTGDNVRQLVIEMPGIGATPGRECGTHLLYPPGDNVLPVGVTITPLPDGAVASPLVAPMCEQPLGEVLLRLYDPGGAALDLGPPDCCAPGCRAATTCGG